MVAELFFFFFGMWGRVTHFPGEQLFLPNSGLASRTTASFPRLYSHIPNGAVIYTLHLVYNVHTMQRTQILLDEWQHAALKARAEREGRSVSDIVREFVSIQLGQPKPGRNEHAAIEGIGEDKAAYGRDHDQFLYARSDVPAITTGRRKAGPTKSAK